MCDRFWTNEVFESFADSAALSDREAMAILAKARRAKDIADEIGASSKKPNASPAEVRRVERLTERGLGLKVEVSMAVMKAYLKTLVGKYGSLANAASVEDSRTIALSLSALPAREAARFRRMR